MANSIGQPVWFDLFSDNIPKTTAFYSELFNWNTEVMDTPAGPYTIFKHDGKSVAGLTKPVDASLANTWLAYVNVTNINTTCSTIQQNGGTLVGAITKMPGVGSWQVAKDPQGGIFCAFQGETSAEACAAGSAFGDVGQFCWHELMCKDYSTALNFYSQVFGWSKGVAMDMGPMGTYQMFNAGEKGIGGMMTNTPDMPQKTYWLEYIHVQNVDETVARAKSMGATSTFPAMTVGDNSGRIAGLIDPNGAAFAVYTPNK